MALLCGEFNSSTISVSSLPLLPFLGLCFYLMSSLPPQPPIPSLHLFFLPPPLPLLSLSLSPSFCAQHVWWSQLYSWELNTQNCSVPWIEARCSRNPESLPKDSVCLFNWLPPAHTYTHPRLFAHSWKLPCTDTHLHLWKMWRRACFPGEKGGGPSKMGA